MSDDFFDDFGWMDMALAGSLAEEMCDEEQKRRRLEQETEGDEPDCCCEEPDPCEPLEETLEPPDNPSDEDPYP
jgi:hypothetical protein